MDGVDIGLDRTKGFAATFVRGTLTGMTDELKGVEPEAAVRVEVDLG